MSEENEQLEEKAVRPLHILYLREKLNEGTINQRQYGREIGKLLGDVDDDTLNRFDELEQAFDDGDIDRAEYEKQLAAIFPPVNQGELTNIIDKKKRLPIFISYGHDDEIHGYKSHEKTVFKIKEVLEARGHKVWIDKEGIREGTDWRRKIYDGIQSSQLFLAFLSKKSIESEYCKTEIRIAVGAPQYLLPICPLMLENVEIPKPISHIQAVHIFEDKNYPIAQVDFRYDEKNPSAFESGMKQLTDWIDLDEHATFCQELESLWENLGKPESFEDRLGELMSQPFVGREWLQKIIDKWDSESDSRLFCLIGGPGYGKSVFTANLRYLEPEKVAAAQFIEWHKTTKYTPKSIIKSLAFQLAARIAQYRRRLIDAVKDADLDTLDDSSLFDKLLSEPLSFENPNNTYWIILDALDEATAQDGQNPFVQTLMRNMDQLPKWLKFIVTSRPDAAVIPRLKDRGNLLYDMAVHEQQDQHKDMLDYLYEELKKKSDNRSDNVLNENDACLFDDDVLECIIAKSQGMFLYLHFVCQDIKKNNLSAEEIRQLPDGINKYYQSCFDRRFGKDGRYSYETFKEEVLPLLQLSCSAYEPLPLDFLAEARGISVNDVRSAIDKLGTLKTYSTENGRDYFNFVHKSIWDWLAKEQSKDTSTQTFRVAPEDGQSDLTKFCLKKIKEYKSGRFNKDANLEYPLKYVAKHLIVLKNLDAVWEWLGGKEPRLPQVQYNYFGDYIISLNTTRDATQFFLSEYRSNHSLEDQQKLLPKVARLMLSFSSINT